ncbi:hypothetical protein IW261DRAFT_1424883 [Armillaria novae-zelandiae]|uniref:Uncharacterized protein n=1 Tax=Armillaria novae-zelandiae TaxID=153914 RepID=A0AA39NTZ9_9AGAR|nr:hypothetical protein IW261DRAFT_1424883 [Armillaria novae-zelandiae]
MSGLPAHQPEDGLLILRRVFSTQSTALVDSEPAVLLDSIADILPILTSHGLHFSPDMSLKLVAFGLEHRGAGHLISSSKFYYIAVTPILLPASTPELPTALHSDPSSLTGVNDVTFTLSATHFGDSDADIPAGTNVMLVGQWNEIHKEKELADLQFEELKEELDLSKLRVQKLEEIESHQAKALQRLNSLEQNLSNKRDLLESAQHECCSIKIKLHNMKMEAEQYCAEIKHQDAVISKLKEFVSHNHSFTYAQSLIVNESLVDDLQGEVTCLQEVNEALHTTHSEGVKLFELFKELELQLSQISHEISSCATLCQKNGKT